MIHAVFDVRMDGSEAIERQTNIWTGRGKIHKVYMRRPCNKNLRHAMHLFADKSRKQSAWAASYYEGLRERGKTHAQALRCLGQRWLKIIWKMWQTQTPYDAELHMKNQIAHGSWVLKLQSK